MDGLEFFNDQERERLQELAYLQAEQEAHWASLQQEIQSQNDQENVQHNF